jgi:hypothetical protein
MVPGLSRPRHCTAALALLLWARGGVAAPVPVATPQARPPAATPPTRGLVRIPLSKEAATQACVPPRTGSVPAFAAGERLEFEIDSLGAVVGTLSMTVIPGRGAEPYTIEARGKTGTFAANFYPVDALAQSRLGRDLLPRSYFEDATEQDARRTVDVAFPTSAGVLPVHYTEQGNARDYEVAAPDETRDLLSALYLTRALPLADGSEFCLPVFAGKRVWILRAKVTGREPVRTPAGDYATIHLEGTATRADNTQNTREVHFWLTDDEARTPVAAFGLIQNKPVRAQLVRHDPGRRRVAAAPRR